MSISRRMLLATSGAGLGLAFIAPRWRPLPVVAQEGGAIGAVATFSILDDMVKRVGGDRVDIHTLVPAGADAHTFEPAPADAAMLAAAAIIFAIGVDFEPWLAGLIESTGTTATVIATSARVPLLEFAAETEQEHAATDEHAADDHADEDDHAHGQYDPHIWHDVTNAMLIVEDIRDGLIAADPDGQATYEANADAYLAELSELDDWVQGEVDSLAPEQRKLVTSHDALGYYAHRYGLTLVGTAFASLSTEGGDPSAAQIAALVQAIKDEHVTAIFAENVSNPALMEAVAAEAGVTLAPSLYTDALTGPDGEAPTYIDLITVNTNTIVGALTGN